VNWSFGSNFGSPEEMLVGVHFKVLEWSSVRVLEIRVQVSWSPKTLSLSLVQAMESRSRSQCRVTVWFHLQCRCHELGPRFMLEMQGQSAVLGVECLSADRDLGLELVATFRSVLSGLSGVQVRYPGSLPRSQVVLEIVSHLESSLGSGVKCRYDPGVRLPQSMFGLGSSQSSQLEPRCDLESAFESRLLGLMTGLGTGVMLVLVKSCVGDLDTRTIGGFRPVTESRVKDLNHHQVSRSCSSSGLEVSFLSLGSGSRRDGVL
uniref:Uncharacterized protein n=1 Tax=Cannabis sativa TaxID=3483 RepID=A0A803P586_CANSA